MFMTVSNPYEKIDWDAFRNQDGSINLVRILESRGCPSDNPAIFFAREVSEITPIKNRQVAALTLMTATFFAAMENENE